MAKSLAVIKSQLAKIEEQKKALVAAERVAQRETVYELGKLITENPTYLTSSGLAAVKKLLPDFGAVKSEAKPEPKPDGKPALQQAPTFSN